MLLILGSLVINNFFTFVFLSLGENSNDLDKSEEITKNPVAEDARTREIATNEVRENP